jgi:hypothetical protein
VVLAKGGMMSHMTSMVQQQVQLLLMKSIIQNCKCEHLEVQCHRRVRGEGEVKGAVRCRRRKYQGLRSMLLLYCTVRLERQA